ncbi:MAG TPA: prenyltransferase/squalene oxidase repeat-containing protein [Bryobacteraceae bacterium]|nr:prenyltransferase/squalene oxidase repeat-containing protein [Bryobacteraceae bacterium]
MIDSTALARLREAQNADGGWGYFRGKQSWLEPTVYAAMALHGEPAADRAWDLLKSWQGSDGGWRPSASVPIPGWGTSLCVSLAIARGEFGEPFKKGVAWLLSAKEIETALWKQLGLATGWFGAHRDFALTGWPWKEGQVSWVEPNVHGIVALKQAAAKLPSSRLRERVRMAEAQLIEARCPDNGWNYGSSGALGYALVAFPETTGLALIGLQGHPDIEKSLELAAKMARETGSPLARAWLTIALRVHGAEAPPADAQIAPTPETTVAALTILAESNPQFFRTGAVT